DAARAAAADRERGVRRPAAGPAAPPAGTGGVELVLAVDGRVQHALVVRQGDRVLVALDGRGHAFALGEPPRRASAATGAGVAVAPMPGKVIRALVPAADRAPTRHAPLALHSIN